MLPLLGRLTRVGVVVGLFWLDPGAAWAQTNAPAFAIRFPDAALYLKGRFVYDRNCVVCHGEGGDGAGIMAPTLVPKPRSFRSGVFKYRSTPPGALPTDDDLSRTVRQGLADTSMPAFNKLTASELRAVIAYLKFFSPRWRQRENYAPPLPVSATPAWFETAPERQRRAARGGEVFAIACAACHGSNGDGNGSAVAGLEDTWGAPSRPPDLRKPFLRSGRERSDVYRVLLTGLDGTPMPSFAETITPEQRWELVAFIEQLRSDAKR